MTVGEEKKKTNRKFEKQLLLVFLEAARHQDRIGNPESTDYTGGAKKMYAHDLYPTFVISIY